MRCTHTPVLLAFTLSNIGTAIYINTVHFVIEVGNHNMQICSRISPTVILSRNTKDVRDVHDGKTLASFQNAYSQGMPSRTLEGMSNKNIEEQVHSHKQIGIG